MAQLNFNAQDVAPQQSFDLIPAGWYTAVMVESELKPTKNGDGSYLACQFKIQDGEHNGRTVFDNLNINNPNPKTVEIAYSTLSSICHAVGMIKVQDSTQLHNRPLMLKVSIQPAKEQFSERNVIKGYKAVEHAASQLSFSTKMQDGNKKVVTGVNPPWVK